MIFPIYNRGLVYHKISEQVEWGLTTTTPSQFKAQMQEIKRLGFTFSTLKHQNPEKPEILVTFDDGYASVMDHAAPILDELKGVATVFAISKFVGRKNSWDYFPADKQVQHMSWSQLRDLHDLGWEIGSHGCSHRRLLNLSRQALDEELKGSKREIEDRIGDEVTTFCPPYNAWNSELLELIEDAGYENIAISYPLSGLPTWKGQFVCRLGVYLHDILPLFRAKLLATPLAPIAVLQQQIINLAGDGKILESWLHPRSETKF